MGVHIHWKTVIHTQGKKAFLHMDVSAGQNTPDDLDTKALRTYNFIRDAHL